MNVDRFRHCYLHGQNGTANPTWEDIFECCFKAQSSKLERFFPLKRGKRDVRALCFELSKMSPQVGLAVHTIELKQHFKIHIDHTKSSALCSKKDHTWFWISATVMQNRTTNAQFFTRKRELIAPPCICGCFQNCQISKGTWEKVLLFYIRRGHLWTWKDVGNIDEFKRILQTFKSLDHSAETCRTIVHQHRNRWPQVAYRSFEISVFSQIT